METRWLGQMPVPPAFPVENATQTSPGMSLRDWFAGQAVTVAVAHVGMKPNDPAVAATFAYAIADALLAERQKETR